MEPPALNATIEERRDVHEAYAVLHVRPDVLPIPPFLPGQFVQLGLPEIARPRPGDTPSEEPPRVRIAKRSYSIASSARETDHYEFCIALVPGGRFTPELWKLGRGSRCWAATRPLGSFTLQGVPAETDLVMLATGTGLSPYLSMLRTHPLDPPWRRFTLIHGVRHAADLAYRDELEARERDDARFRYVPVVSRDPAIGSGTRGHVQAVLEPSRFESAAGYPLDPATCHVFLCGNPAMVRDVRELLEPRGFRPPTPSAAGSLHYETYW